MKFGWLSVMLAINCLFTISGVVCVCVQGCSLVYIVRYTLLLDLL